MSFVVKILIVENSKIIQTDITTQTLLIDTIIKRIFVRYPEFKIAEYSFWDHDETSVTIRCSTIDIHSGKNILGCYTYHPLKFIGNSEQAKDINLATPLLSYMNRLGQTSFIGSVQNVFINNPDIEELDLSRWNVECLSTLSGLFNKFSKIRKINVSTWNTHNVSDFSKLFYCCSSLETLDVSQWDTHDVKIMSGAFYGCSSLKSLDVSQWDTHKVIMMDNVFTGCSSLETLDVSQWDTHDVLSMFGMFDGCSSLKSLNVSKWDTSSVTNTGFMFNGCKELKINSSSWNMNKIVYDSNMSLEMVNKEEKHEDDGQDTITEDEQETKQISDSEISKDIDEIIKTYKDYCSKPIEVYQFTEDEIDKSIINDRLLLNDNQQFYDRSIEKTQRDKKENENNYNKELSVLKKLNNDNNGKEYNEFIYSTKISSLLPEAFKKEMDDHKDKFETWRKSSREEKDNIMKKDCESVHEKQKDDIEPQTFDTVAIDENTISVNTVWHPCFHKKSKR